MVAGQALPWVSRFKYLGSQFSSDGSLDAELAYRKQLAMAAFRGLYHAVWGPRSVQLGTKMRVFRAMVQSVLLYGAHCWALTAAQLRGLEAFQCTLLRQVLGVRRPRGPGGMSNKELRRRCCEQPTMAQQLRRCRGRFAGHVDRMGPERLARQLQHGTLAEGKRRRGRPPLRLSDVYTADIRAVIGKRPGGLRAFKGWGGADEKARNKLKRAWNALF